MMRRSALTTGEILKIGPGFSDHHRPSSIPDPSVFSSLLKQAALQVGDDAFMPDLLRHAALPLRDSRLSLRSRTPSF